MSISREINKAIVEGVNMIKKHNKPNAQNPQGGITEKEALLHISNLSLLTSDGKTTRVGYRVEDGSKVRVAKKTDEVV
jgi:large subunit ribosomal protein L24